MLAVLLLPWIVLSTTASLQCLWSSCFCPDYTTAVCTGYLAKNFTKDLDPRLQKLTLRNTNITEASSETVPDDIVKLILFQNRWLQKLSFEGIPEVQHLEIYGNSVSEIYPITDKYLDSLNSSDYPTLPNLQVLYLSRLPISNLELLLQFFSSVREFHLSQNNISFLSNIDSQYPHVKVLDLAYNPITSIPANYFHSMQNLETLQLEWTRLISLSGDEFRSQFSLTFLRLDGNKLITFNNDAFMDLSNLRKLRLSKTQLVNFQSALTRNLTKLEELYLNDNEVTTLAEHVFDSLEHLNILNLTNNSLESIPRLIFKNQKNLTKLYLGGNALQRLDVAVFSSLKKLHTLSLERNRLEFLEQGTFETLSSLRVLDMSENMLKDISSTELPPGSMLQKLFLQWNSLGNIGTTAFQHLKNLDTLRLDGNDFQTVSIEAFDSLDRLKSLNMSECDMLECNCDLEKLRLLCKARNIEVESGIVCHKNGSYRIPWSDLKVCSEEVQSEKEYMIIIIIGSVLLLLLAASFPVARYLLQRARSDTSTWCAQNTSTDPFTNPQSNQVRMEEDYDIVSAEEKVGFSHSSLARQEGYIEPAVPKVILPTCKPVQDTRKVKRRRSSLASQVIISGRGMTVPKCKAPAAPPDD